MSMDKYKFIASLHFLFI